MCNFNAFLAVIQSNRSSVRSFRASGGKALAEMSTMASAASVYVRQRGSAYCWLNNAAARLRVCAGLTSSM